MGKLDGRVAVVTVGGAGIGAAIVRRLSGEGAAVVVTDLSGTRAGAVAESVTSTGGRAVPIKMDAADSDAVERTLALERFGRLDIMINNAGVAELAPLQRDVDRELSRDRRDADRSVPRHATLFERQPFV